MSETVKLASIAIASTCAFAVAAPAGAQLLNHKDLTASIAVTIAQTVIETCKTNGYAVSATVVGRNGEIIVQVRGDNANPHTMENSFRKAYTARTTRSPSGALNEQQTRGGRSLPGSRTKNDPTATSARVSQLLWSLPRRKLEPIRSPV
jgi:uncharacterized protein GlcG (DUF336 family)